MPRMCDESGFASSGAEVKKLIRIGQVVCGGALALFFARVMEPVLAKPFSNILAVAITGLLCLETLKIVFCDKE